MAAFRERIDEFLVHEGFYESPEKARTALMSGYVYVDGKKVDKPGTQVKYKNSPTEVQIEIRGQKMPYVSRGGFKLKKAIDTFALNLAGLVCMDIGASTGGFTDCMLQSGAAKVYAVDVGYGQLDFSLRNDARVRNMERVNFRSLTPADIDEALDFASIDVSFISLDKIFPVLTTLLKSGGRTVALIKPQFEAPREKVGKNGIVRDPAVHREVIEYTTQKAEEAGLFLLALTVSPIRGASGNMEFLALFEKDGPSNRGALMGDMPGLLNAWHGSTPGKESL